MRSALANPTPSKMNVPSKPPKTATPSRSEKVEISVFSCKIFILLISPSVVIYDGRCLARKMLTVAGAAKDLLSRKLVHLIPFFTSRGSKPICVMVKAML